jgi:predicted nucleic acid-binding protein
MILATAIAGEAVCIITGDKDLLILKMFESIKIIDPKEFANSEEMLR